MAKRKSVMPQRIRTSSSGGGPDFRWVTPVFGFADDITHVGVPESGRGKLEEMAAELADSAALVALYIPESTDPVYEPGPSRGRIVGAVRLLRMPRGKCVEDYFYKDWDGSLRWPFGWPCKAVYCPDIDDCPEFREHVEHLYPGGFGSYVSRFQIGPFRLEDAMRERLNRDFLEFSPLT